MRYCVNCGQDTTMPRWCRDCWWMGVKAFIAGAATAAGTWFAAQVLP